MTPDKEEIVALTLALEEVGAQDSDLGAKGLRFMCREAARLIRRLRPDLAFVEDAAMNAEQRG
jgi:hypothetical protein